MKRCLLLGRPNAGKTAFLLTFASFLGMKQLELGVQTPEGEQRRFRYHLATAMRELVSATPHTTRRLQWARVEIPGGKGKRELELVDTTGLLPGIHPEPQVRQGMAQTLAQALTADLLLHILDANAFGEDWPVAHAWSLEEQIAAFARERGGYLILANKMDLPGAAAGLAAIRSEFAGLTVLPVSTVTGEGYKEVKRYVRRYL